MESYQNAINSPGSDSQRGVQHALALFCFIIFFRKDRAINQTCVTIRQLRLSQLACLYARQTEGAGGDEAQPNVPERNRDLEDTHCKATLILTLASQSEETDFNLPSWLTFCTVQLYGYRSPCKQPRT